MKSESSLPAVGAGGTQAPVRHQFLAVDDGTHTLIFVDEEHPARNWSVDTGYVMDLQLIAPDRVLLSVDDGFREYDVASGKLLSRVNGSGGKTHSIYRARDGRTFLAGENLGGQKGATLLVYDHAGQVLQQKVFEGMTMLRHLRLTSEGTYLLAAVGQVAEVDSAWHLVHQIKVPGNLFKAIRLPNGNILCSSGPGGRFLKELNPQGAVVREVRGDDLPEGSFTGFHVQPNGHIAVANWLGHGREHNGISLLEYDTAGKVVWRYGRPQASYVEVIVLDAVAQHGLPTTSER